MKQNQAATAIAEALASSDTYFDSVSLLTRVEGDEAAYVLVNCGDTVLSVTVEILAQP